VLGSDFRHRFCLVPGKRLAGLGLWFLLGRGSSRYPPLPYPFLMGDPPLSGPSAATVKRKCRTKAEAGAEARSSSLVIGSRVTQLAHLVNGPLPTSRFHTLQDLPKFIHSRLSFLVSRLDI
jgi:hypothetical protein